MAFILEYFPLVGKYGVSIEGIKYNKDQQDGLVGKSLLLI